MKIERVDTYVLKTPLGRARFYSSQAEFPERNSLLVRLTSSDGLVGWGEGGQYGPAKTDVMRSWLAEGRISGDTYVWREGWPDWREAERVFPQLSFNRTFPEFDAVVAMPPDTPTTPLPEKSFPSSKIQLAAVGVVALVVFVLFLVFLAIQLSK